MTKFKMKIRNVKNISKLDFDIPTTKGLYAITGENGSGKSTIISALALSFYIPMLNNFFGVPRDDASIKFDLDGSVREIGTNEYGAWKAPNTSLNVNGFYEGSIVYGNRFKSTDYDLVSELVKIKPNQLYKSKDFIRDNLGDILHGDANYYGELHILKKATAKKFGIQQELFFYENFNTMISQLQMSTGENLMLTILNSIEKKLGNIKNDRPMYILLDEIELALHSAAIHRFILFLESLISRYNVVIIFSTHSSDILRRVSPGNIYYVQNISNGDVNLINPCYPAYATRRLEAAEYGYDFIILVEDYLAREVIDKILREKRLMASKKVMVLPVGGWQQVLRFANDIIHSHLTSSSTKILIVLDKDVEGQVPSMIQKENLRFSRPPKYLPVQSLEKYLLKNLVTQLDYDLMNELTDYIFQSVPVVDIIQDYNKKLKSGEYTKPDGSFNSGVNNGKNFYYLLKCELEKQRKTESELVAFLTEYLFRKNDDNLTELVNFFVEELK